MTTQSTMPGGQLEEHREPRFWNGLIAFAAFMFLLLGGFHVLAGLVALLENNQYLVDESDLLVPVNYTVWGVTHIVIGAAMFAVGLALLLRKPWARALTVALALVSAVTNLGFLAANPPWFTLMIAIDVLIIYAVTAHGGPDEAF